MIQVTREALLFLSARESSSSSPWLRNANRVVVAVGLAVSTSALIMRIYTKARIMKKFWWDDGLRPLHVYIYELILTFRL